MSMRVSGGYIGAKRLHLLLKTQKRDMPSVDTEERHGNRGIPYARHGNRECPDVGLLGFGTESVPYAGNGNRECPLCWAWEPRASPMLGFGTESILIQGMGTESIPYAGHGNRERPLCWVWEPRASPMLGMGTESVPYARHVNKGREMVKIR